MSLELARNIALTVRGRLELADKARAEHLERLHEYIDAEGWEESRRLWHKVRLADARYQRHMREARLDLETLIRATT